MSDSIPTTHPNLDLFSTVDNGNDLSPLDDTKGFAPLFHLQQVHSFQPLDMTGSGHMGSRLHSPTSMHGDLFELMPVPKRSKTMDMHGSATSTAATSAPTTTAATMAPTPATSAALATNAGAWDVSFGEGDATDDFLWGELQDLNQPLGSTPVSPMFPESSPHHCTASPRRLLTAGAIPDAPSHHHQHPHQQQSVDGENGSGMLVAPAGSVYSAQPLPSGPGKPTVAGGANGRHTTTASSSSSGSSSGHGGASKKQKKGRGRASGGGRKRSGGKGSKKRGQGASAGAKWKHNATQPAGTPAAHQSSLAPVQLPLTTSHGSYHHHPTSTHAHTPAAGWAHTSHHANTNTNEYSMDNTGGARCTCEQCTTGTGMASAACASSMPPPPSGSLRYVVDNDSSSSSSSSNNSYNSCSNGNGHATNGSNDSSASSASISPPTAHSPAAGKAPPVSLTTPAPPVSSAAAAVDTTTSGQAGAHGSAHHMNGMKAMAARRGNKGRIAHDATPVRQDAVAQFIDSLTYEERALMEKEGAVVHKLDYVSTGRLKELKAIRRKIKNKLSAKHSRMRRKEYISTLESEKEQMAAQIKQLQYKVSDLQHENCQLRSKSSTGRKATPTSASKAAAAAGPGACAILVMALALSTATPQPSAHTLAAKGQLQSSVLGGLLRPGAIQTALSLSPSQRQQLKSTFETLGITTKLAELGQSLPGSPLMDIAVVSTPATAAPAATPAAPAVTAATTTTTHGAKKWVVPGTTLSQVMATPTAQPPVTYPQSYAHTSTAATTAPPSTYTTAAHVNVMAAPASTVQPQYQQQYQYQYQQQQQVPVSHGAGPSTSVVAVPAPVSRAQPAPPVSTTYSVVSAPPPASAARNNVGVPYPTTAKTMAPTRAAPAGASASATPRAMMTTMARSAAPAPYANATRMAPVAPPVVSTTATLVAHPPTTATTGAPTPMAIKAEEEVAAAQ
ncbi:hypothetical protein PTSG_04179 [Salpingoeca rosetta]|uniref:BZIP domain-containing protein n=1 Tax=Salpingoeca rosetta (strain ATCC 50818 / BSB-021) TaxID=946362 RepID=F2U6U1_SALR5|nr:uncharacterized protein PTSG_04179 [Salpingoeca rosetta]EGD83573.1 hypothetical protein PTSG_04179 [Salpingoeca rosetta]|eukprot:XP_004995077.1 hypothetical protein PTSG_04179 [Salpingoeca rosetta]